MIFFTLSGKFTAVIENADLRVTASPNERTYTLRAGTTHGKAAHALFNPTSWSSATTTRSRSRGLRQETRREGSG